MSLTHPNGTYSNGRPIPPEPPCVATLQAIRRRLWQRPTTEQDRIIKGLRTQVAAETFLATLPKPDIEPKLSNAELIRRQAEIDRVWEGVLAERAARAIEAGKSCHTGPADPDWPERRSDKVWIWGDKAR
jgi:hypothetical protein